MVRVPSSDKVMAAMRNRGILFGIDAGRWYSGYENCLILACTESNTPGQIDEVLGLI